MRSLRRTVATSLALVATAVALDGCESARVQATSTPPRAVEATTPEEAQARALAARLPGDAERCLVTIPPRLAPSERSLGALVSPSERLPWQLGPEVVAHARAERTVGGARASVEYVLFREDVRAAVRAQLGELLGRAIAWDDAPADAACEGELTCRPLRARFADPHTLVLAQGTWPDAPPRPSTCADLLAHGAGALEVGARVALHDGTELRGVETVLREREVRGQRGLERTVRKRYASDEAAARTVRAAILGHDELASIAGLPARELGVRDGASVLTTVFASFADLRLVAADRERLARALARAESSDVPSPGAPSRADESVDRAREERAQLARRDPVRLAAALGRTYALPAQVAAAMARELTARSVAGEDYAQAEWAYLTAHALSLRARQLPMAKLAARRALVELPRLVAWLARAESADGLLEVLARGTLDREGLAGPREAGVLAAASGGAGRTGVTLGASTGDDAALRALGQALARATADGPLELTIGIRGSDGALGSTVRVSGRREGVTLIVAQASRGLARLDWSAVERLLAAPLRVLTGAAYPPDELVVGAASASEAGAVVEAAERAERVRCALEGLTVRCRGPLSDAGAAGRALREVARARLMRGGRASPPGE